jgi:hypothetical protein
MSFYLMVARPFLSKLRRRRSVITIVDMKLDGWRDLATEVVHPGNKHTVICYLNYLDPSLVFARLLPQPSLS